MLAGSHVNSVFEAASIPTPAALALLGAGDDANPELMRLALKLATCAAKTTIIARQALMPATIQAALDSPADSSSSLRTHHSRPSLRSPTPDPDSYYASRELVTRDNLGDFPPHRELRSLAKDSTGVHLGHRN